jgi:DNA-binding GntR family transcriptional regulator
VEVSGADLDARLVAALLRPGDSAPLHNQVEDGLRELIRSGQVHVGTRLPGEVGLAAALGLSRHTVRHALATLVNEGLLRRNRGSGTRVLEPRQLKERRQHLYAFAWETRRWGAAQSSLVLDFVTTQATDEVARRLHLPAHSEVKRIVRVRMADGEPLLHETSYLPLAVARGLDSLVLQRGSIYDEIERLHGLRITRADETISPVLLSRQTAQLLGVRPRLPAFRVRRTTWAGDLPVEMQESLVRGDRFVYSVALEREARGALAGF